MISHPCIKPRRLAWIFRISALGTPQAAALYCSPLILEDAAPGLLEVQASSTESVQLLLPSTASACSTAQSSRTRNKEELHLLHSLCCKGGSCSLCSCIITGGKGTQAVKLDWGGTISNKYVSLEIFLKDDLGSIAYKISVSSEDVLEHSPQHESERYSPFPQLQCCLELCNKHDHYTWQPYYCYGSWVLCILFCFVFNGNYSYFLSFFLFFHSFFSIYFLFDLAFAGIELQILYMEPSEVTW